MRVLRHEDYNIGIFLLYYRVECNVKHEDNLLIHTILSCNYAK
jgi:hypothetical protein